MTTVDAIMWAAAATGVGAFQARALWSQATSPGLRTPVIARLVVVCAFAGFAVLSRAPSALAGWLVGYPVAVAILAHRLGPTS
jgi:hypothetical protein